MRAGGKGGERKSPSIFPLPPRTFEEVVTTTGSASFTASSKCINTGAARAITSQKTNYLVPRTIAQMSFKSDLAILL